MTNEWTNRSGEIEDADKHAAATLAAALIARGFNLPAASNTTMAAMQAVDLYRQVLDQLKALNAGSSVLPPG
jgi:hypothetical protein